MANPIDAPQTVENGSASGAKPESRLSVEAQNALFLQAALGHQMQKAERANPTVVDLVGEGLYSAAYSGAQSPILGIAQIVDRSKVTNLEKSLDYMPAPTQEEFGTARWHAQQIGGAFGMMLPFMATRGTMKATGLSLAARTESTFLASGSLLSKTNGAIILDGAATGFAYDFLMHPVHTNENDFWEARRKNGYTGAITFAGLTAGSVGLRHATRPITESLTKPLSKGVYDVAMGVGSGAPAGALNADASARLHHGRWATAEERVQGAYTFAMAGGALSLAHKLPGQDKFTADKAVETANHKAGVRNLSEMLARRSFLTGSEASAKGTGSSAYTEAMGRSDKPGSVADLVANENLRRGRAMASEDVQRVSVKVAPEHQAMIQKGLNIAYEASDGSAPTAKAVELFEFARGEGAHLKTEMIETARQFNDPRLLTIMQEAYLHANPVHHRNILGQMHIEPDRGVKITEGQVQRWQNFVNYTENPPTEPVAYAKYREAIFNWLNQNPDLHNWARQYAEQNDNSSRTGPIDFYFMTENLGRFVKASEGQATVERPMTVAEIETARRTSAEFADRVGIEPYDGAMIQNFVSAVTAGKDVNLHFLARNMNDALVRENANTSASVGTSGDSITLFRPTTVKTSDPVGRVEYDATGSIAEGTKYDSAQANRVANEFARSLGQARHLEQSQFLLAEASTNLRELGVPAKDVPGELNWVFRHNRMPYEVSVNEQGVLNLSYVQSKAGHIPLVTVRVSPEGQVQSQVHERK